MIDNIGTEAVNQAVETSAGAGVTGAETAAVETATAQGTGTAAAAGSTGDAAAVADAIMADFLRETGGNPDAVGAGANETNTGAGHGQNADVGQAQSIDTVQVQGVASAGQQVGSAGSAGASGTVGNGVPDGLLGVGNTDSRVTGNGALSGQNGLETGAFSVSAQVQTGTDQNIGIQQNEGNSNEVQNTNQQSGQGQIQQNAVPQGNNLNGQNAPVQQSQGQQPQQGADEQGRQTMSAALPRAVTEAEWKELVEAHPEIVGAKLPDEIFKACVMSDRSPLQVYDSMMLKQTQTQLSYLMAENAKLKQDLENFRRAPVVSMAGGAPNAQPKDEILDAFMKYQ